jgi:hypothetical protein
MAGKVGRCKFVQDNDGHWYMIDANEEELFNTWVAAGPYSNGDDSNSGFEDCRLNGGPSSWTFTQPAEEE